MTLKETLSQDLKTAMRENDTLKKNVIRMALSAIKMQEIDGKKELIDAEVTALLYKEVKNREETISDAKKISRQDIIDENLAEIALLNHYLPRQLGEAELTHLVDEAIHETGAKTIKEMGAVMKCAIEKAQGAASNAAISAMVKARLQQLSGG